MSISELSSRGPTRDSGRGPAVVLAEVLASVRELDETLWAAQDDAELVAVVEYAEGLRSALSAVQAGAVAEADARGVAKQRLHYGSTGDWLTHVGGLRRGEGRRVVARAKALTGPLVATRAAMVAGRVSPEQADVIVRSIEELPSSVAVRDRGEHALVDHAERLNATELARTGRHLVHVVDPEATDRKMERQLARDERACHLTRFLSIADDGAGGVRVKGRGSAEDGALLRAVLLPLTSPTPAVDDEQGEVVHDPRDHGARMWDALVTVAQHALDTDLPPHAHGAPARLIVTIGLDALQDRLRDRLHTGVHEGDEPAVTGLAGAAVAGITGVGVTSDGTEVSIATLRRMACDAEILPAVLGSTSEVLDVGRTCRLVTPGIWAALVLRDRHCAFPACTRPPVMCHAHHIVHWIDGGETKLSNLVLLCGHHHRTIHSTPWETQLNARDQRPEFLPPPKPGIRQEWMRHRPRRT